MNFKSHIYHFIILCFLTLFTNGQAQTSTIRYADIPVPDDYADIILPDTAPYAMFIVKAGGVLDRDKLQVNSLHTGKKLWSVPVMAIVSKIFPLDCGVLVNTGVKTKLYDYASKKEKFNAKVVPAMIADSGRLLIGYQGGKFDKLVAYELPSGKQLWTTQIPKNSGEGWIEVLELDSTSGIYLGENLWKLDFLTGECKNLKMKRRIMDKKGTFFAGSGVVMGGILGGMIGGAIGGGLAATAGSPYAKLYFDDLGSNVVSDSEKRMYLADRDAIICVDTALNEVWRTPLPKKSGSKSHLRMKGDTLYLLNTGLTANGAEKIGEAFLAEYNKANGNQLNIRKFPKKWDKKIFGERLSFTNPTFYALDNEKGVISLVEYPVDNFPVTITGGDVVIVDPDLKERKRYSLDNIFYKFDDLTQGTALTRIKKSHAPEIVIIDKDGKITSTIYGTAPIVRSHNGKIVTVNNGSLVVHQ